ncbi:hypothetical protein GZ77_16370 [Endozoicomonas montiporae]|uniref:Uncharacterized protein n=2 Tax=Endozoicomonas montiporae TaxID=1027273 RepID=A0A081N5W7_9GAMM|nr:hypothetical protein [Endozoicomonas montiporae]AMO57252.1 hypothetical protein EZMO1_3253 [Endozoicomonas montiporae CL-33]KEQ13840.1 hypothetical protein GZ77_16370 [Endozoicomonas montiporae]
MSKYIYATVYEQFTGLKPPEPKSHKPRRRRGYGHPYRMRLNLQEGEQDTQEINNEDDGSMEAGDSINSFDHKFEKPRFNDSFEITSANSGIHSEKSMKPRSDRIRNRNYNRSTKSIFSNNAPLQSPSEDKSTRAPKVTYKKRRHFAGQGDSVTDA